MWGTGSPQEVKAPSEVGDVCVEVVRMVTDRMPSSGEGVRDGDFV